MRKMLTLKDYPAIDRLFDYLYGREDVGFLDSSLRNDLGEYSILGLRPYMKLEKGEQFKVNGEICDEPFEDYLNRFLNENYSENPTDLPMISGCIGYLSYEYGRRKEGVETRHEEELAIPECILTFYDYIIVEDHKKGEMTLVANGHTVDATAGIRELASLVKACPTDAPENPSVPNGGFVTANFTSSDYKEAVQNMINYIIEGDIYIVNMTQQVQIHSNCNPHLMYARLRRNNPAPFGAFLDYGDFQVVCASPERFLKMEDRHINTRPIKGTRKRGTTPAEDAALKNELANSEKERSELLMIVDLERNDLNRVCIPGSVKVTELFEVETYATVFHLVSNVEGILRPELNASDLIRAAFPGGSITGAPKLRAMELIDEQEHSRRNLYTGSIGYISLDGNCDFNIVIRTAIHKDGVYHLGVGGGITCESELEFEYEETWQKAKALLDALNIGEESWQNI